VFHYGLGQEFMHELNCCGETVFKQYVSSSIFWGESLGLDFPTNCITLTINQQERIWLVVVTYVVSETGIRRKKARSNPKLKLLAECCVLILQIRFDFPHLTQGITQNMFVCTYSSVQV